MTTRLRLPSTLAMMVTVLLTCTLGCSLVPTSPTDDANNNNNNNANSSPEAFCSTVNAFYCNTTVRMAAALPNGWGGYCMAGDSSTTGRIIGYSGVTSNGGAFLVTASHSTMSGICYPDGAPRACVSIVMCTRR